MFSKKVPASSRGSSSASSGKRTARPKDGNGKPGGGG
eukprot:CAMPEP_0181124066 /NCGR_PEP_ID=MMETSP1071-20121207/26263_1 /TAXON_ID=35127 /ORGANISM="Thalassiosira sp., Strain NH16" /LENGTH=36 /DNA_ID= /DNA_START= /DNA_END= /DNA_ORIENTATION=